MDSRGSLQRCRLWLRSDRLICSSSCGGGSDEIQIAVGRVMVMMVDNSLWGRSGDGGGGSSNSKLMMMMVLGYHRS